MATTHFREWAAFASTVTGGAAVRDLKQMYERLEQDAVALARTRQAGIDVQIEEDGLDKMVDRVLTALQSRKEMTL